MMAKDTFDAVLASVPQGATAGRVVSKGAHFEPVLNYGSLKHWESPPKMKPVPNRPSAQGIVGVKFGRFTVIGLLADRAPDAKGAWVCRCVCGDYEPRSAKAIRNPNNKEDACKKCRHLQHIQREYKRQGARPIGDFFVSVLK